MSINSCLEDVIKLYERLIKANQNFLITNPGEEGFFELVDNRSMLFDDLDLIREDLIKELSMLKAQFDYSSMELPEIIRELPNYYPETRQLYNQIIENLKKLIESEKNVDEEMQNAKEELKNQIHQTRRGNKTLNAYKPLTGYTGSHFLDKTK